MGVWVQGGETGCVGGGDEAGADSSQAAKAAAVRGGDAERLGGDAADRADMEGDGGVVVVGIADVYENEGGQGNGGEGDGKGEL